MIILIIKPALPNSMKLPTSFFFFWIVGKKSSRNSLKMGNFWRSNAVKAFFFSIQKLPFPSKFFLYGRLVAVMAVCMMLLLELSLHQNVLF
jgi:hypothetical protein